MAQGSSRALPEPTTESRPFWEGAAEGELMLPRCEACGTLLYPPPPRCTRCLSDRLTFERLSGDGVLRSWTKVMLPGVLPGVPSPFVVAEIELAEQAGLIMVAHLTGAADPPTAGLPVRIAFDPSADPRIAYPRFEPAP